MRRPEAWLLSYALLGLTQAGLVPVLMPLAARHGAAAGITFAAFSMLGVFAPILGAWADRAGRHRDLLVWGTLAAGLLLLGFAAAPAWLRLLFAAGAGLGTTAATTAGNIIAIQGMPEDAWDSRVALLQRFVGAGQVVGLAAAGLLAHVGPGAGFLCAGASLLAAGLLAAVSAPAPPAGLTAVDLRPQPIKGGDAGASGPHHHGHHVSWEELAAYLRVINRPMRRFLLIWLVAYAAMNGFAALFPVAMVGEFGLDPLLPTAAYAAGVGLSLAIYPPVGAATHRLGGERMLAAGFAARLLLLVPLAGSGFLGLDTARWLALAGFALIQFVWPLLAVAANSLSVRYAPTARGESVGLFNAATALASAAGSALAGVFYHLGGFAMLAGVTLATVAAGLLLDEFWLRRSLSL